jgi:predicted RNA-binding Zn ribbon-like protein
MTQFQDSNRSIAPSLSSGAIELLGGWLCLDFVNTVDPRRGSLHPRDYLTGYADLVQWSRLAGILSEEGRQNLLQAGAQRVTEAGKIFERAIVLRETIYRIFSAVARSAAPQQADLDALQQAFAEAMQHASLISTPDGFACEWFPSMDMLDCPLWPIISSAMELLTSTRIKRVKECPGVGDCGWLFLDTSKNGSRMWCSMDDCGSRAKMRRQYARKRGSRSEVRTEQRSSD